MENDAPVSIGHVNKETLELLERRLEAKVRASFFRSVTLPIGGGGILGILIAVLWWVPNQVEKILRQESVQAEIHARIQASVEEFFEEDSTREELALRIEEQVERNLRQKLPELVDLSVRSEVQEYFATGRGREDVRRFFESREGRDAMQGNISLAVKEHLASEEGRAIVTAEIDPVVAAFFEQAEGRNLVADALPGAVADHFDSAVMREAIGALVDRFLAGDGKEILIEAVNTRLKPAAERTSQTIERNAAKLIELLYSQAPDELFQEREKGAVPRESELAGLRRSGRPVVLTLNLRSSFRYNRYAIQDHISAFRNELGDLFRHVAVLLEEDGANRFVALVPPADFEELLARSPDELERWLNDRQSSLADARAWARASFPTAATRAMDWTRSLEDVLKDATLWADARDLDAQVAVVDSEGRLLAATSRRRLIEGMLRSG